MSFLDQLRAHLHAVDAGIATPAGPPPSQVNFPSLKRYFIEASEREGQRRPASLKHHYRIYAGWIERFVARAMEELRNGLCADADVPTLLVHVRAVIDALVREEAPSAEPLNLRSLETARIAETAGEYADDEQSSEHIVRYASGGVRAKSSPPPTVRRSKTSSPVAAHRSISSPSRSSRRSTAPSRATPTRSRRRSSPRSSRPATHAWSCTRSATRSCR